MIINRNLFSLIQKQLNAEPKVIILYGPRQAGKTTLIRLLLSQSQTPHLYFSGDDLRTQELFSRADLERLKAVIGANRLLVIDEAQYIENIGRTLKLIFDDNPIHIIASGSSSFDLANKISEPLTGRVVTFTLFPLSYDELPLPPLYASNAERLEEFLRFGMYPKVVTLETHREKEDYLYELINGYLYRDVLTFESIHKPKKVIDLLTLLALQIGSEVSIAELATRLALSKPVVEKYLDILEKMFVLVNLRGFSRNLRKEISKTSKYYFVDLGVRNALIRNFNPLHLRADVGALFENYAILERIKCFSHQRRFANFYFWRTYDRKEIDLIEEQQGMLTAYEFKWGEGGKLPKAAREFTAVYPNSQFQQVTPATFDQFIGIP